MLKIARPVTEASFIVYGAGYATGEEVLFREMVVPKALNLELLPQRFIR